MINLSFSILNPFSKDYFKPLYSRWGKISTNKSWEFEVYKQDQTILELNIDTCFIGKDHAGITLYLSLLSYAVCVIIQDNRHWDYETHTWKKHVKNTNC